MVAYAAGIALTALFAGTASAQCGGGDGIACEAFKTTQCGSSVYDVSFVLDKSGSMGVALVGNNGISCNAPTSPSCKREDIMRYVLRQVNLEVFRSLQQPCLEYEQSALFTDTRISCAQRGFTKPRLQNVWWSNEVKDLAAQTFDGPLGSNNEWNNLFKAYFYDGDAPKSSRWTRDAVTGELRMNEDAVKDFFEKEFLRGTRYPRSDGTTYLSSGLNWLKDRILNNVYRSYTDKQKAGATFPIFVMTDGELTRRGNNPESAAKNRRISEAINRLVGGKAVFTGLGLTANGDKQLRGYQQKLYNDMNYRFDNYFFDSAASTERIIKEIFGTIQQECEECYTFNTVPPTTKCVPIGAPEPEAPGAVPKERDSVEVPEINENTPIEVVFDTVINDITIKYGDTLQTIPRDTKLCYNQYKVDGEFVGTPFVEYDPTTYECECCAGETGPCLCDFRAIDPIGTSEETIAGIDGVSVDVYDQNDLFIESISRGDKTDFPAVDPAPPTNGNDTPEETDATGGNDSTGSGTNDGVEDGPDRPDEDEEESDGTVETPDTVNAEGTAASLLPSLAGLVLASLPFVLA